MPWSARRSSLPSEGSSGTPIEAWAPVHRSVRPAPVRAKLPGCRQRGDATAQQCLAGGRSRRWNRLGELKQPGAFFSSGVRRHTRRFAAQRQASECYQAVEVAQSPRMCRFRRCGDGQVRAALAGERRRLQLPAANLHHRFVIEGALAAIAAQHRGALLSSSECRLHPLPARRRPARSVPRSTASTAIFRSAMRYCAEMRGSAHRRWARATLRTARAATREASPSPRSRQADSAQDWRRSRFLLIVQDASISRRAPR